MDLSFNFIIIYEFDKLSKKVTCTLCSGDGKVGISETRCRACYGSGKITESKTKRNGTVIDTNKIKIMEDEKYLTRVTQTLIVGNIHQVVNVNVAVIF